MGVGAGVVRGDVGLVVHCPGFDFLGFRAVGGVYGAVGFFPFCGGDEVEGF